MTPRRPGAVVSRRRPAAFLAEFGNSLPVDKRMWAEDIRGSIAHARMLAKQGVITEADADAIEAGLLADLPRDRSRDVRVGHRRRRRPHGHRARADRAHRTGRRAPAHRAQPQRPGRHRHAALRQARSVEPGARRPRRCAESLLAARRGPPRRRDARLHAPAEGAAGAAQPPPARVRADAHARLHPLAPRPRVGRRPAARQCSARGHDVPARPRLRGRAPGLLGGERELDGRGQRPRLPARPDLRVRGLPDAPLAPRRGAHPVVERRVRLHHAWTTSSRPGRSIMPQKKNPDFAELVRGKTGRVFGDLQSLLVTLKGLPLAYNKDMQEDKEPAFDAIDTLARFAARDGGHARTRCTSTPTAWRPVRTGGFMAATDLADYLVGKGVPFREAHEIVGRLVLACERDGRHAAGPHRRRSSPHTPSSLGPTCSTRSTSRRSWPGASPPAARAATP